MSTQTYTQVPIPTRLARKARGVARKQSTSLTGMISQALRSYFDQIDEQEFLRAFRKSARKRGIRSQRDVVRMVNDFRRGR